jgi:hypothetical protein
MPRVARECRVIAKEPETRYAWWWGSHTLHLETALARDDHHASNRRHATKPWETTRARWKHKEPVPRKEGRLH